jgi:hypothetical protein
MTSIYQEALGSEFTKLHPQMQKRFGFSSEDKTASIGKGIMREIWHGAAYTLPFLSVGTWRRIMFPEFGKNVPFRIENYAFIDELQRETVTWIRTFDFNEPRRFDAYMIYSRERKVVVDYLGSHQHLAVDIELSVDERGGMKLISGAQRFYEGAVSFTFPMIFSGVANVCEWFDDRDGRFHIEVKVNNKQWGPLFGYSGDFDVTWLPCQSPPAHVLPARLERRE